MELTQISPDEVVYFQWGFVKINATLVYTWFIMAVLIVVSWLVTRRLTSSGKPGRWQNFLEAIVSITQNQIREVVHDEPKRYLPFIGTLFLFIVISNVLAVVPGFIAPTASLSSTAALALCVLIAVPVYGVMTIGVRQYLLNYVRPSPFMLPFNILGELSRTLALAVRLFGNMMSASKVGAILLAVIPLFFPVIMNALGLLTGVIQAYIFAILALVYIASGMRTQLREQEQEGESSS